MSLTNITAEFLRKTKACEEVVKWYDAHPSVHDWPWEVVCSVLEAGGQWAWSRWVRQTVAEFGAAEDRSALRGDTDARVRETVAEFGTAEDRAALSNDPNAWVRQTVAIHGSAKDRAALRNDPDPLVRWAVVKYGGGDPK